MNQTLKKSLSIFFALTLLFSPVIGAYLAPKSEAQIKEAVSGCAAGMIAGMVSSFLSVTNVPTDDTKNNLKECLDGIGYALAKTLLAKLTDSIINWINTGFEGNPFYIADYKSFFETAIKDELQASLDELKQTGNLYFDVLRQEAISRARETIGDQLSSTLAADIVSNMCDSSQYKDQQFCTEQLTAESESELTYAFTRGQIPFQWDTWNSLTQKCGNNIFCSSAVAEDYQEQQKEQKVEQINKDLDRSGGFLNQETCADEGYASMLASWQNQIRQYSSSTNTSIADRIQNGTLEQRPVCTEKIVETPGRTIADKLTSNLGTSERQLELADELNESLAAIFDALINKLITDGLSSFDKSNRGNDSYYRSLETPNNGFDFETTDSVLSRDKGTCEAAGGSFDPVLEVCDFSRDDSNNTPVDFPDFPWVMQGGTAITDPTSFAIFISKNPSRCVQIDEVRVQNGIEPCLLGESGNGQGSLDYPKFTTSPEIPKSGADMAFTIYDAPNNRSFEIKYSEVGKTNKILLGSGTTGTDGRGNLTVKAPVSASRAILVTVDFGFDIVVEKTIELAN